MARQQFGSKPWERDLALENATSDPFERAPRGAPRAASQSPSRFSLASLGLAQPSIKIALSEVILYLNPSGEDGPTDDPCLNGSVVITLPKPKTFRGLSVQLIGKMDIAWPAGPNARPYESVNTLEKEVKLFQDDEDTVLEKGKHTFEFSIIVPSNTARYERCTYGRVRHTVVAKATGVGVSEEKEIWLIVNPNGAGESQPPPSLDYQIEGMGEDIGPYRMSLQSQHIMVGGLLHFQLHLVSPPQPLHIHSVDVKILQTFTLQSFLDRSYSSTMPLDTRVVLLLDSLNPANYGVVKGSDPNPRLTPAKSSDGPLKTLKEGEAFKINHLGHLPTDAVLSATSLDGTQSGINVKHSITVEIKYILLEPDEVNGKAKGKKPEGRMKKYTITKPLDIFSCYSYLDSLTLPAYAEDDPNRILDDKYQPPCVCGMSIEALMKRHGEKLMQGEGEGFVHVPTVKSSEERAGLTRRMDSSG